jgi:hypothetical protein
LQEGIYTVPTESPSAYSARVNHNAAITNSKPPVQNRSNIPSPAQTPLNLPKMTTVNKTIDPGLARLGRIAQSVAQGPKK